ncbi:MAG: tRNA uridine-5-carboxymethylaminomethyl(34) synthesis GTPase MnmE [Paracoccaceae bacterium]
MTDATVFALATPPGVSGVAVIRLSGPAANAALSRLTDAVPPMPRIAALRTLRDRTGGALDRALVLRFPGPASFTGEDVVELHCHGSRAVIAAVLDILGDDPDLTPAEPGEFTRRAFANGRMDLTEVEALGDLLSAETEAQRRFAMVNVSGALRTRAEAWREALLQARALVEATIDWVDEEVPEAVGPEVAALIESVSVALADELAGAATHERLRDGFEVAILGAPNAGKSTLLNTIAGREAAIATPVPGTTRDVLEVEVVLEGLPVRLLDTAGLRETEEMVERLGVAKALERAAAADLRLFLEAPDAPLPDDAHALWREGDLDVATKGDLRLSRAGSVSALTGEGVGALLDTVALRLRSRVAGAGLVGHSRQRDCIARALDHLRAAGLSAESEIVAERLRLATRALESLTGRIDSEAVLGAVFSRFCLGK